VTPQKSGAAILCHAPVTGHAAVAVIIVAAHGLSLLMRRA